MSKVIVKYKVKADRSDENIGYVQKVFSALEAASPEGLRYVSFMLEDGLTFVHIALVDTEDGKNPLIALPEFQAFIADISSRCDEPPAASPAEMIGSYGVF